MKKVEKIDQGRRKEIVARGQNRKRRNARVAKNQKLRKENDEVRDLVLGIEIGDLDPKTEVEKLRKSLREVREGRGQPNESLLGKIPIKSLKVCCTNGFSLNIFL
jgi:hypothetical protein